MGRTFRRQLDDLCGGRHRHHEGPGVAAAAAGPSNGCIRCKSLDMWPGDFEMPLDWRAQRRNYRNIDMKPQPEPSAQEVLAGLVERIGNRLVIGN
jgi:hypothetical protein